MSNSNKPTLSYEDAGVSIDAGNALVENIKPLAKRTHRPGVMGSLGGFGGCFEIPVGKYKEPILVSGTDGVGTKLRLAIDANRFEGIGIDLVAMCANDLIVMGAEPLFFLDYYATGKLNVEAATQVIASISEGCVQAGCALIGGETAEMPGMYHGNDFDLAGFCVGVVEKSKLVEGEQVTSGDTLIALASSGPHSNGYSLIRKVLEVTQTDLNDSKNKTLLDSLLAPTKLYIKSLLPIHQAGLIKAAAHITGGGFWENIPRVLPSDLSAHIKQNWTWPEVFNWLEKAGNVDRKEMYRTFNCGVGMILVVNTKDTSTVLSQLKANGENAWIIGDIQSKTTDSVVIEGING